MRRELFFGGFTKKSAGVGNFGLVVGEGRLLIVEHQVQLHDEVCELVSFAVEGFWLIYLGILAGSIG
jgi:hypothetical protein